MKKLLLFLLVSLLYSCCNEPQEERSRTMLTDEQKAWVPYELNQKIDFVHSNGNEFQFEVINDRCEENTYGGEHCGEGYVVIERRVVNLQSNSPDMKIKITTWPPNIGFKIGQSSLNINFNIDLGIDSVMINDVLYRDVFIAENPYLDSTKISPENIYYNNEYGIIQIQMSNDESFTLNN